MDLKDEADELARRGASFPVGEGQGSVYFNPSRSAVICTFNSPTCVLHSDFNLLIVIAVN